jgi:predicted alpha/beta superfamily hydrolase
VSTIVFHDEQTLPEWNVDAALPDGVRALSVPNAGEQRAWEYVGDGLDAHVERLVDVVCDAERPVGVAGSSFGAYASLYAWAQHPQLFTRVLAMSPALWVNRDRLFDAVERVQPAPGTRVWIDVGGRETERFQAGYDQSYADMRELLERKGITVGGYRDDEGIHHESAWASRLPEAMQFLFAAS